MLYSTYTIGGELMHSSKGVEWGKHKYIDRIKTKTGKWRYIYESAKKRAGYTLNYGKNKGAYKRYARVANSNRRNAQAYRNKVKELDEIQNYFGVKDADEPIRKANLEKARELERYAESQERKSEEAKRKMEKSAQYQFKQAAINMGKEAILSKMRDLGYDVDENSIDDLLKYLRNM